MEHKLEIEPLSGLMSLLFAVVATATGRDIGIWSCAAAGMAGIFGSWCFTHSAGITGKGPQFWAILTGTGLASLFGPILANASGYYWPWLGSTNYFIDVAAGLAVGLVTTPVLGLLRNPLAIGAFLASLLPWTKKGS